MDGSPLSFSNLAPPSEKLADRVNGAVHYAIGFLSGLVWQLTTPQDVRRKISRERLTSEWGQWVRRMALTPDDR